MSWQDLSQGLAVSALYSMGGLVCGVVLAILLLPLASRGRTAALGQFVAVGLKSVPAFIFPLLFGHLAGPGVFMKILVSGLICFFPVFVGAREGLARVPPSLLQVAHVYGATTLRTFSFLEAPWLFVGLLEGIKAAAPLAVVGAIVAEYVDAADVSMAGLGVMFSANRNYPATLAVICLAATGLGFLLYVLAAWIKRYFDRRLSLV